MILPGVTRDSVVSLAKGHVTKTLTLTGLPEKFEINERPITMKEVKTASQNGTLVELFGAGNEFLLLSQAFLTIFSQELLQLFAPLIE
jgi:branched-chain amino acid aminotransferase